MCREVYELMINHSAWMASRPAAMTVPTKQNSSHLASKYAIIYIGQTFNIRLSGGT